MTVTLTVQDGISPKVAEMLRRQDAAGKKKVLTVIGITLRDWAVEAFTEPGKRPASWKNKRDGTASTLQGTSPVLRRSLRVEATADSVTIGTDRKYALIHQLGGEIEPRSAKALRFKSGGKWWTVKKVTMPARPYLPVRSGGTIMPAAAEEASGAALDEMTAGL
jgi:phage gpG-like protein